MLVAEGENQPVIGGGSLEFEIESAAEALPEGEAPGSGDAGSERCMENKLHAPAFIEKAFGNDSLLRGQCAQFGCRVTDVGGGFEGTGVAETAFVNQERWRVVGIGEDSLPQSRHVPRKFTRTPGSFPQPEGNGGCRAVGVFHAHPTALHPADSPGVSTEEKYLTGMTFDGEVLIKGTDRFALRFGDDGVVGVIRNCAT